MMCLEKVRMSCVWTLVRNLVLTMYLLAAHDTEALIGAGPPVQPSIAFEMAWLYSLFSYLSGASVSKGFTEYSIVILIIGWLVAQ